MFENSYEYTFTITAAGTSYGKSTTNEILEDCFNVAFANELYAWTTHTFAETVTGDESVTVTIERQTPDGWTTVLTFSTRTDDATEEEKYAYTPATDGAAPGAENKIGSRIRLKAVATGSAWTASQSISIVCKIVAIRR